MKRFWQSVFLISFCLLLPVLFGQSPAGPDSLELRAKALIQAKQYAEALSLLEPAMDNARQAKNWELFGAYAGVVALVPFSKNEFEQGQLGVEQAIRVLQDAGHGQSLAAAKLWSWKAVFHVKQEQFSKTLAAYQQAIQIFEANKFKGAGLAFAYKNAAQIYQRLSNDRQSIAYLEAALRSDTSRTQRISIYAQLAASYLFLDSLAPARQYYGLGLAEPRNDPYYFASLQSTGAELALRQGDLDQARKRAEDALQTFKTIPLAGVNCANMYTLLADVAARLKQYAEAESCYRQALLQAKAIFPGKSREIAKILVKTGQFFESNGHLEQALNQYQEAMIQVFPGFNNRDLQANPSLQDVDLESQAMFATTAKALALLKEKNLSVENRLNAAYCFDLSFAVAALLRRTYGNDADKFALAANNRESYRAAALNLWNLYRESRDSGVLTRLFGFLEQTKAQALGDALQKQHALALSGISDSLQTEEQNLRLECAAATKAVLAGELSGDTVGREMLKERLFRRNKSYDEFLQVLNKTYPQFNQYVQAGLAADTKSILASLPDTTALLSWFDAGDRYLCIVALRNGLSAYEVPVDSVFDQTLRRFLNTLTDKPGQETHPEVYFADAWWLKQRLLPDSALARMRHLVIIPDGRLSFLPFEALLTASYQGGFGAAPYLLRKYAIQYAWSASLLTSNPVRKHPAKGLLQVAPFLETTRDGLALLPNSLQEKPEKTDPVLLRSREARADAFLQQAPDYAVLHLSTHAHAGLGAEPVIEFADRSVFMPELYAQRLNASLVSLSACETGAGHFAEGEGVLSLARAFAYAGARSLVASHWSVNERSTAELFAAFYRQLEKGLPKAEALRQAKLNLLDQPGIDARKAPYYWAAFTMSGVDGPVDFGGNGMPAWVWWLAGGMAIVLAFWALRRRKALFSF